MQSHPWDAESRPLEDSLKEIIEKSPLTLTLNAYLSSFELDGDWDDQPDSVTKLHNGLQQAFLKRFESLIMNDLDLILNHYNELTEAHKEARKKTNVLASVALVSALGVIAGVQGEIPDLLTHISMGTGATATLLSLPYYVLQRLIYKKHFQNGDSEHTANISYGTDFARFTRQIMAEFARAKSCLSALRLGSKGS